MSVQPSHPTTALRAYGFSNGPVPAVARVKAASEMNTADERPASSSQDHPGSRDSQRGPEAHGVLRLLEEGHFRGVAEARLRLHFLPESTPSEQTAEAAELQQRMADVSDRFVSLADALVPPELQTEAVAGAFADALATFQEKAKQAAEEGDGVDTPSFAAYLVEVQAAFDSFSESIRATFTEALDASGAEEGGGEGSDVSFQLSDFMARLSSTFSEMLSESAGEPGEVAGDQAEAGSSGDGAAYDRIVAEYNRHRSPGEVDVAERVNVHA